MVVSVDLLRSSAGNVPGRPNLDRRIGASHRRPIRALAGHEQAADTMLAHAAERHATDWFVVPGHTLSQERTGNEIKWCRRG